MIEAISADFAGSFTRRSFLFEHSLASHPLLSIEELAKRLPEFEQAGHVTYRSADNRLGDAGNGLGSEPKRFGSAIEALQNISAAGAWIKIRTIFNPEYKAVYDEIIEELSNACNCRLNKRITYSNASVFISSPGSVTPYHFDHEDNALFQIHGKKTIYLFDAGDPDIMSNQFLETYYVNQDVSGISPYNQEIQNRAQRYDLVPGLAVHNPSQWPHWVKTGDEPSLSLSIGICLREQDRTAQVHQFNYYLRRMGLRPTPPGRSIISDGIKKALLGSFWPHPAPRTLNEHLRGRLRRVQVPLKVLQNIRAHFPK